VNYTKAWELLERSCKVKRILITRHLSALINLPALDKESIEDLTKLVDDAQQHVASLVTLGVSVGQEMIVHILETKVPKSMLDKWEAPLTRDAFPKLEDMYEFLYKTAVCASRREGPRSVESEKNKSEFSSKKRRFNPPNQAFITKACIVCKDKQHFTPAIASNYCLYRSASRQWKMRNYATTACSSRVSM